jgi:ribosome biogenesis GTPase A
MLGSRVTFRLAKDLLEAIEKEAMRRGFVTPRGKPNVSSVITHILRDWFKARPKQE